LKKRGRYSSYSKKKLWQRTTNLIAMAIATKDDDNLNDNDIDDDEDKMEVIFMQVSLVVDQIPEDMRLDSLTCFYRNAFYPLFIKKI